MNILEDDIEEIAAHIKRRILRGREQFFVYARQSGVITMLPPNSPRNAGCSEYSLVGCYTRAASAEDIAEDLRIRQSEILEWA
jgi:hypothetical protein